MAAEQMRLEGDVTAALGFEQNIRMQKLRQMTKDEVTIRTLAATQDIAMEKAKTAARIQQFNQVAGGLSQMSAAMTAYAGENKKMAKAAAAVAMVTAIVNTAGAVMSALNTPPFFPVGIAMGALAAATGAIQIATIASQSFAKGGRPPVGVTSLVGEAGPELFMPDVAGTIIPNNRLGSSRHTYITIEVNYPTVRSDEDIDKLAEEVSQRFAREAERL